MRSRWLILALVVLAQLMVVLDATIVNIALPSAQADLGFSNGSRQWIVTGYALAFGSLLPLGGRLGDVFGRRRTLVLGSLGFAGASALGGAAQSFEWLLAARVLQGMFGAVLAPSALALLTTTFTEPRDRNKAFGIFGAVVGSGAAVGLLLGGALTEYLSWRWCLYVNLFLALPVTVGALMLVPAQRLPGKPSLDLPGAATAAGGLFLIVFGFDRAQTRGLELRPQTIGSLVGGVALLGALRPDRGALPPAAAAAAPAREPSPGRLLSRGLLHGHRHLRRLPLRDVLPAAEPRLQPADERPRVPADDRLGDLHVGLGQRSAAGKLGPRPLVMGGMLLAALGLVLLTRLTVDSTYAANILPSLIVIGAGLGLVFPTASNTATARIDPAESGVASSLVNVGQQVGGSVGTALLNTIAVSATTAYVSSHHGGGDLVAKGTVHGYTVAFWWSAGIFAVGALVCGLLLPGRPQPAPAEPVPVAG